MLRMLKSIRLYLFIHNPNIPAWKKCRIYYGQDIGLIGNGEIIRKY
jgi:hypothetical protein